MLMKETLSATFKTYVKELGNHKSVGRVINESTNRKCHGQIVKQKQFHLKEARGFFYKDKAQVRGKKPPSVLCYYYLHKSRTWTFNSKLHPYNKVTTWSLHYTAAHPFHKWGSLCIEDHISTYNKVYKVVLETVRANKQKFQPNLKNWIQDIFVQVQQITLLVLKEEWPAYTTDGGPRRFRFICQSLFTKTNFLFLFTATEKLSAHNHIPGSIF